jgi:hypothetical protein
MTIPPVSSLPPSTPGLGGAAPTDASAPVARPTEQGASPVVASDRTRLPGDSGSATVSVAPQLAPPHIEVDDILENLQSLLPMFLGKGNEVTQEALGELIKSNAKVSDELAKSRIGKIREAAAQLSNADNKTFWGSVLNIAGKALAVIGAVVGTVASGGALGPVLLPLAAYSILSSVGSLINEVMKLSGHPEGMGFELTVGNLFKAIAKWANAQDDTANALMEWTDKVVNGLMVLGCLCAAVGFIKMGVKTMSEATVRMQNMANKFTAFAQITGGVATTAASMVNFDAADARKKADDLRADNKELEALVFKSQQLAQFYYEALRDAVQYLASGQERLSEIANRHGQSQKVIQANMV